MAKRPGATKEFRVPNSKSSNSARKTQTSVAYRTARVARERQKREIELQKREKLIFALFVVVILVMILFAILIFKKVLETEDPEIIDGTDITVTDPANNQETEQVNNTTYSVSVSNDAVYNGNLLLIDSAHPFRGTASLKLMGDSRTTFGTGSSGKPIYSYYLASTATMQCDETALKSFNKLADAFYQATGNIDLFVNKAQTDESTAHSAGLLIDLKFWTGNDYFALDDAKYADDYKWLENNYYKYGFALESDADHQFCFRYVGIPHSYYMHKYELGLKAYLELVERETIAFTTDSGDKYEVSYVGASGDILNIQLPSSDTEYEISGNNIDGIVVTVKTN